MDRIAELKLKEGLLFALLEKNRWQALVLGRQNLFSWLTGGLENRVVNQSPFGNSHLLITARGQRYILATRGELDLVYTELLQKAGYEPCLYDWDKSNGLTELVSKITGPGGAGIVGDGSVAFPNAYGTLVELTKTMFPVELERYRRLGEDVGKAFSDFAAQVTPGLSELQAQAILTKILMTKDVFPAVLMVGADEKPLNSRHFLPDGSIIKRRLSVIACLRREGLVISITRDLYFDKVTADEDRKHQLAAEICAGLVAATASGRKYRDLYVLAGNLYREHGCGDLFREHPVGGPTGYEIRYEMVTGEATGAFQANQAVAWNPTLPGFKSEDTYLITEEGCVPLVHDIWPQITFDAGGIKVSRPGPLVLI